MVTGTAWSRMCPANQAIVSFTAQYSSSIYGLTLSCAPLVVSPDGMSIAVGAPAALAFLGNTGSMTLTAGCAAGSIATGTSGWDASTGSVTGFALSCSPISLTF
jgi:hypothetical protein